MAETISVRLGEEVLKALASLKREWQIDRSETIRRLLVKALKEWKIESALEKVRERKISVGKAAEECGISLAELLVSLKEKNIDWTGYDEEDLEMDLKLLE